MKAAPLIRDDITARHPRPFDTIASDIRLLITAGILSRDTDGHILFPFDAVKVEFSLQAA